MNDLISRRRMMGSKKKSRLPAEYQEVEWLATDGKSYIRLGITPARNSEVVCNMKAGYMSSSSGRRFLFSDSLADHNHYCEFNEINQYAVGSSAYLESPFLPNILYDISVDITPSQISILSNGVSATTTDYSSGNYGELILFRINAGYNGGGHMISECTIMINGELSRIVVPCYRKSDVVRGYYDILHNTFIPGSYEIGGNFILGPEV